MEKDKFVPIEKNQMLTLENRSKFTVSLVENAENFSEEEILLKTALGGLCVTGKNLKLEDLSMENGTVILTGTIDKMEFTKIKEKHGFLNGLFR